MIIAEGKAQTRAIIENNRGQTLLKNLFEFSQETFRVSLGMTQFASQVLALPQNSKAVYQV